jgi:hypothetical protein
MVACVLIAYTFKYYVGAHFIRTAFFKDACTIIASHTATNSRY